ncbi:MAG: DUF4389 domain-containing protein [Bacteroidota bacterium]
MKIIIKHQETYSRGELLLRSFFGFLYIGIPHFFVLFFLQIGLMFINFVRFWIILFTGKWPKVLFDYAVKLQRYSLRVSSRLINLSDGYPQFGLNGTDDKTDFDIEYKESQSQLRLLGRFIFGVFLLIPHIFVLYIKIIGVYVVLFVAWWVVLFTGKYPKDLHNFVVGVLRHGYRLVNYLYFLCDDYPSFSNSPVAGEITEFDHV